MDYGEFIAAMLHLNKIQREDHMYAAFSYFDKDGSGYITPDELQTACQQFGLDDTQLEDIIREVDQDNVNALCCQLLLHVLRNKNIAYITFNTYDYPFCPPCRMVALITVSL